MGVFVMGYGIVRFLIEFVRVPDAQLGYLLGCVITMGQLLSLPLVIAGWCRHLCPPPQPSPACLPRRLPPHTTTKGTGTFCWWFCLVTTTEP